jgi:hypothetical protein
VNSSSGTGDDVGHRRPRDRLDQHPADVLLQRLAGTSGSRRKLVADLIRDITHGDSYTHMLQISAVAAEMQLRLANDCRAGRVPVQEAVDVDQLDARIGAEDDRVGRQPGDEAAVVAGRRPGGLSPAGDGLSRRLAAAAGVRAG